MSKSKSKSLKKEIDSVKKKVSKIVEEQEIKEFTIVPHTTWTSFTKNGEIRALCNIAQGDEFNLRTARQITPTSLTVKVIMRSADNARTILGVNYGYPVPYRLILVQDMGYSGTAPTLAQILEGPSPTQYDLTNYVLGYNDDFVNVGKSTKDNPLRILADKKGFLIPRDSTNRMGGKMITIRTSKLKKIQFTGSGSNDYRSGAVYLVMLVGSADSALENNQLVLRSTLRFRDD